MLQLLANAAAVHDQNKLKKLSQRYRSAPPTCPATCRGCETGDPAIQGCNTMGQQPAPDAAPNMKKGST